MARTALPVVGGLITCTTYKEGVSTCVMNRGGQRSGGECSILVGLDCDDKHPSSQASLLQTQVEPKRAVARVDPLQVLLHHWLHPWESTVPYPPFALLHSCSISPLNDHHASSSPSGFSNCVSLQEEGALTTHHRFINHQHCTPGVAMCLGGHQKACFMTDNTGSLTGLGSIFSATR